jgi:hypothetical protein
MRNVSRNVFRRRYVQAKKAAAKKRLQRRLNLEQLESRCLLDASGLVGYWQFDNAADLGLDSSSLNNQLEPFGGTAFSAAGQTGGAAMFDGVNDTIAIDNGGNPNDGAVPVDFPINSSDFSFSVWVQPTGSGGRQVIGWGNAATNNSNALSIDGNDDIELTTFSTTLQADGNDVGANIADGGWHHIAGVFNGTTRSLWVDGSLVSSDIAGPGQVTAEQFRIGNSIAGAAYSGGLDELAVFSTPLNQAEIDALAAGASADNVTINTGNLPTPIGYWTFDSPATIGQDSSPLNNDLTPFGDSIQSTAGGRFDNGLNLGGSADYLAPDNGAGGEDTNAIPTNLPIGNESYTVSTWIKPTATGDRGMVGWGAYGAGRQVNAFRLFNANGFRHYWWGADLDVSDAAPANLDDGQWHHAVATYDGTTRQVWLDGSMLNQDTPGANNAQARTFRIGNTNNGENFQGMLDDMAIWNVGLSSSEIQGLANGSQRPVSPNNAPVAGNDSYNGTEDQPIVIDAVSGLLANDSDSDGDGLSALMLTAPSHGTVVLNGDGSFQYTPDTDYFGADSFTYKAIDSNSSSVATVSLSIANATDTLVAVDDTYVANPGATIDATGAASPLLNDTNPDQVALTFDLVNGAGTATGTFNTTADGFTYTPANANFVGTETAVYTISGGGETSNQGTITFVFDNQPVAVNDDYTIAEDGVLTVTVANSVLGNDTDAETDPLTAALVASPANGSITFAADGSFEYTPNPNFAGVDTFTYRANDGDQNSTVGIASINVTAVNDAPVASDDSYVGIQNQQLVVPVVTGVAANDIDIDGPALTVSVAVTTTNGVLNLAADGSFTYTPDVGFTGTDVFTYSISDGGLTSNIATSEIHVLSLDEQIVINEIHYEPLDNSQAAEFIELYHAGATPVNLGSWTFSAGVNYTFPANTMLNPGEYIVVAEDPATIQAAYSVTALGPFIGSLSNTGERIDLSNSAGIRVDRVEYGVGFPWPLEAAGSGPSMELINPSLDNNLGGSWRTSSAGIVGPIDPIVIMDAALLDWSYRKGQSEASSPIDAWRQPGFVEDASWLTGQTPIGYADGDDNTTLSDMQNAYSTVYLRNEFTLTEIPEKLTLRLYVDDGAIAWINGTEVGRPFVSAGDKAFDALTGVADHEASWVDVPLTDLGNLLNVGTNTIAIHAINVGIGSSDLSIDAQVVIPGNDGLSGEPTPEDDNSVFTDNAAPQIRQVDHSPKQPAANQATTLTAKVTDPDGVESVTLHYQVVLPGSYLPAWLPVPIPTLMSDAETPRQANPEFENPVNWTDVVMVDDGSGADAVAGDGTYTAQVPGQGHRTLVRYRMTVEDTLGESIRVPYAEDPSLNFAFFTYDGVPDYDVTNSVQGGPQTYTSSTLNAAPVYHLIARNEDVVESRATEGSTQIPQGNDARFAFNWGGTWVYDGDVYDHIKFRLRGGNGRYQTPPGNGSIAGKRNWRIRFNKGNFIQAKDQWGDDYPTQWRTLNIGRMFGNRIDSNWGLSEQVNFNIWNEVGVPAPYTHTFQWRVIDDVEEAPADANGQYNGDFWGIARAFEDYDRRFLDAHDLPQGNLYKLVNQTRVGLEQQRYQAPDADRIGGDHDNIENNLNSSQSQEWINTYVNYDKYYAYHAIAQAVRHYDYWPSANKNAAWYFYPNYTAENNFLGEMWTLPFDSDASWGPNWNSGIDRPYDAIFGNSPKPEMQIAYRNAIREVADLIWQPDQLEPLTRQLAAFIDPLEDADRDRWTNAPAEAGRQDFAGQLAQTLEGKIQDMMNFAFSGGNWPGGSVGGGGRLQDLLNIADNAESGQLPATPSISFVGGAGFAIDDLNFSTTNFSDPQGANTFGAIEWRLAEFNQINNPGSVPLSDPSWTQDKFELEYGAEWESGEITTFDSQIEIPTTAVEVGKNYRVRVRMQDDSGRWSHWSGPIQFTAAPPNNADDILDNLRITEVMYNPTDTLVGEVGADNDDYEFIELHNTGPNVIDLTDVQFTDGIVFDFATSSVTSLQPDEYVVVVRNQAAFESRYGNAINIAGEFPDDAFSNSGETVELSFGGNVTIHQFSYDDGNGWPALADGKGASMDVVDTEANYDTPTNWQNSVEILGSPGRAGVAAFSGVVINEVLTHTDLPQLDSIELLNVSGATINIGGWWISDDCSNLHKFQIPANTMLDNGDYIVFTEDDFNSSMGVDQMDFGLDGAHGDELFLVETSGGQPFRFIDAISFGGAANGETLGRFPNGNGSIVPMAANTIGAENSVPRVGPVVISEINYNPVAPVGIEESTLEFVEIINTGNVDVNLLNWSLTGANFDFAGATTIPAGDLLVVVSFDPVAPENAQLLSDFRTTYGIDASVELVGGFSGSLSNGGELVQLLRPDDPPLDEPNFIPELLEDEADYDDATPWPTTPDGGGTSLTRLFPAGWGSNPLSWVPDSPTPGSIANANLIVTDLQFNANEIDPPDLATGPQPTSWEQQRSEILTIDLEFNRDVVITAADIVLTNLGLNVDNDVDVPFVLSNQHVVTNGSQVTIQFDQNELPEGVYQLELLPTVTDGVGNQLDGDNDGNAGGSYLFTGNAQNQFYRLLSEFSGDDGVSVFDFSTFSYWFGTAIPTAPSYADMNRDLGVSVFDFTLFANNFGKGISYAGGFQAIGLPTELVFNANENELEDEAQLSEQVLERIAMPIAERLDDIRRGSPLELKSLGDTDEEATDEVLLELLARDVFEA